MQDGNSLKTEKELIYKCKKDLDNFSEIYETYAKDVFRYVYIILKDKLDTEDIVSETFLIALKKIKRFSWQGISIKFWLFGIARNLIKQKKVNLSNISFNEDMKIIETDEIGLEGCVIRDEERDTVKRLMLKLDDVSREIFALRIWEELSFKEIAQLLEIKEASARKIYSRGIFKIKKLYEDERRKDIRLKAFTSGMLLFSIKRIEDLLNFIPNSEFNNISNKIQSNLILNIKKYNMQDIQNPQNLGQEVTKAAAVNTAKTKIIYTGIAILTIVAVAGGIGGYVYLESKEKEKAKDTDTTQTSSTTTTQTTTGTTVEVDPYEGWKKVELPKMDYQVYIPIDWEVKEELDSAQRDYQAVFTDDKDNKYYISSMCQLGDCGICEYKSNTKVLYTITFLGKSNIEVEFVDCYYDPVEIDKGNVLNRTIYFNADSLEGNYSNLTFGTSIEDTESSLEELQVDYTDLKKVLESFEVLEESTKDWKIYKNDEFNIEFKYPSDWEIEETIEGTGDCKDLNVKVSKNEYTFELEKPCASSPSICVYSDTKEEIPDGTSTISFNSFEQLKNIERIYRRGTRSDVDYYQICQLEDGSTNFSTITNLGYVQYFVSVVGVQESYIEIMDKILLSSK